jgi:hypothetical protein
MYLNQRGFSIYSGIENPSITDIGDWTFLKGSNLLDQGAFPAQNPPKNVDSETVYFGESLDTIKEYNRFAILYQVSVFRIVCLIHAIFVAVILPCRRSCHFLREALRSAPYALRLTPSSHAAP